MPVDAIGSILNQQDATATRQNTIDQASAVSMKRAMVPPKLHISADRNTSRKPTRSSRGEMSGEMAVGEDAVSVMGYDCRLSRDGMMHNGRQKRAAFA